MNLCESVHFFLLHPLRKGQSPLVLAWLIISVVMPINLEDLLQLQNPHPLQFPPI
jgi:hypothetical protein